METLTALPATTVLGVVGVGAGLYYIIKLAYPRPLPGIPYDEAASRRLLGDLPGIAKVIQETGDALEYFQRQAVALNSPIYQTFTMPFAKPGIVIADYRESHDIMAHRIDELDRSDVTIELFHPLLDASQFTLKTDDEKWKFQRRLVQDTMSPAFLREVATPNLYAAFDRLVDLWQRKARLADGRPFEAEEDIHAATFDGVIAFTFGGDFEHSATAPRVNALEGFAAKATAKGLGPDHLVHFPAGEVHEDVHCFQALMGQMEKVLKVPAIKLGWLLVGKTREYYRLRRHKNAMLRREIEKAATKAAKHASEEGDAWVKHAADLAVERERRIALREGRQPNFDSPEIGNELFTFIVAGHETTATATSWALKILTAYPGVQAKLRESLRKAYPDAAAEGRRPSVAELAHGDVPPYIEAFMAEIFRHQSPTPMNGRTAKRDCVILGHHIPKGTNVSLLVRGPSFQLPSFNVDSSLRTASARKDQAERPIHEADDMDTFRPERWFVNKPGSDRQVFDATAWPNPTFGGGKRGCFGKRLAYLEFRMLLTLIVWDIEFLEVPKQFSSWAGLPKVAFKPQQCIMRMRAVQQSE